MSKLTCFPQTHVAFFYDLVTAFKKKMMPFWPPALSCRKDIAEKQHFSQVKYCSLSTIKTSGKCDLHFE